LNGITDSIRRQDQLRWVHMRQEETAAFDAGAETHVTGRRAVCGGSCGAGNLHLMNGLHRAHEPAGRLLTDVAAVLETRAERLRSANGIPHIDLDEALGAVERDVIAAGPLEDGARRGRYVLYRELVVAVNRLAADDSRAAVTRAR
jgi:hypothetical protein